MPAESAGTEHSASDVTPASAPTSPHHILIVDDDPHNRDLLAAEMVHAGHTARTAPDGRAGVAAALEQVPDLVLMDLAMPQLDGFGAIAKLRADARTELVPIIIMSAMVEVAHRVRGLKLGANDYICKPFDLRDINQRVGIHLRLQELERLRRQQQRDEVALEVLGAAAHELAQPVNGALGYVQLMLTMAEMKGEQDAVELTRDRFEQIEACLQKADSVLQKLSGLDNYHSLDYAGGVKILNIHQTGKRDHGGV